MHRRLGVFLVLGALSGCMIGPDYQRPAPPTATTWSATDDPRVVPGGERLNWWRVFDDPPLERLVEIAYRQNPTLAAAGLRVVQAQALRGIAVGNLFPQTQQASASF